MAVLTEVSIIGPCYSYLAQSRTIPKIVAEGLHVKKYQSAQNL